MTTNMHNAKHESIYSALVADDRALKLIYKLYSNPFKRYTLIVGAASFLLSVLFLQFKLSPATGICLIYLALLCLLVYWASSIFGNIRYLLTPTKSYINDLIERLGYEENVVIALAHETPHALTIAQQRIEFEKQYLISGIGFTVGIIDKLGIFPALISLYLTYAKANNDPALTKVPYLVFAFICSIYISAFIVKHIINRFEVMQLILGYAREKAEQQDKDQQQ